MKKAMIEKLVSQALRKTLKPTGLLGKRGPAKNVHVLVRRHVEKTLKPRPAVLQAMGLGMSE